jgi:hypothetical protein
MKTRRKKMMCLKVYGHTKIQKEIIRLRKDDNPTDYEK